MRLLLLWNLWADYQHLVSLRHRIFGGVTVVYLSKDEKINLSQNEVGGGKSVCKHCAMIANKIYCFLFLCYTGTSLYISLPVFMVSIRDTLK